MKKILFMIIFPVFFNSIAYANQRHFLIRVSLKELKLYLIDLEDNVFSYPVAGPSFGSYPYALEGIVQEIQIKPVWYPTEKTRRDFLKKGRRLPRAVPPGPQNPLGAAALKIHWTNWKEPVLIHGTNDPSSIGRRVTRGCIRLHNKHIMEIVKLIQVKEGGSKVRVIIENH